MPGALQQVVRRTKAIFEEIHQRGPLGHLRQARVIPHQHVLAGVRGKESRAARSAGITVSQIEQARFDDDCVELAHHPMLERVSAFG